MGWLFTSKTRDDLVQELLKGSDGEKASMVVVAHEVVGTILWSVVEITAKEEGVLNLKAGEKVRFIRCDLLRGSTQGWGYKSMEESSHPYYYSCPLYFLDMAPVQSADWRDGVREFHKH